MARRGLAAALLWALLLVASSAAALAHVTIGSKAFPESWILGDALTALVESTGEVHAEHKKNLGGTEIAYQALLSGNIDAYPEYTGTVAEVILKSRGRPSLDEMRQSLGQVGLGISGPLGFSDNYAVAITPRAHTEQRLTKISDLRTHPDLRVGFTHEFLGRDDGWPGLAQRYGIALRNVRGIQHELAYEALEKGQLDATDIYTTDPQIEELSLVLLEDDLSFFQRYEAVIVYRLDLASRAPAALRAMNQLVGAIDTGTMMHANAAVASKKATTEEAARMLLHDALAARPSAVRPLNAATELGHNVARHLQLVGVSLFFAVLWGIPLGILATRSKPIAVVTLAFAGLLQTIPSLALLAFLIPVLGIGLVPALVALFLYSLLPIVRNTFTGLTSIAPAVDEAADGIGLTPIAKLFRVSLPLASPAIMAGIKTSAIINVGTATLAALIGAEGLGNPILQGIALRDNRLILEGAVPAALLALMVEGGFYLLDRLVIPKGLRLSTRAS